MFKSAFLSIVVGAFAPVFWPPPAVAAATPASSATAPAHQRDLDPASICQRVYAVVPIVSAGMKSDPSRPMLVQATEPSMTNAAELATVEGGNGTQAEIEAGFQTYRNFELGIFNPGSP